jgi:predicted dehydrogenase
VGEAVTSFDPGYVVIATETENHAQALADLAGSGFSGRVLVEKPILPEPGLVPVDGFEWTGIGYNLRFHPGVLALRSAIGSDRVLSAHARVGQFLPEWRPGRDYRDTVTAGPAGGVLLELSHELDLLNWLTGPIDVLYGAAVHTGTLEIERDDLAVGVLGLPGGGLASFELSCIDRLANRSLTMTTTDHTVALDLLTGQLQVDGEVVYQCRIARNETFAAMHKAALTGGQDVCSVAEAMTVVSQVQELRSGNVRTDAQ